MLCPHPIFPVSPVDFYPPKGVIFRIIQRSGRIAIILFGTIMPLKVVIGPGKGPHLDQGFSFASWGSKEIHKRERGDFKEEELDSGRRSQSHIWHELSQVEQGSGPHLGPSLVLRIP